MSTKQAEINAAQSDQSACGHMPALEAVLMAARGSSLEARGTLEAEFAAAASNSRSPEKPRRATDEFYADLRLQYQRLGACGSSRRSGPVTRNNMTTPGRYSLTAFDHFKQVTVPPASIKPQHFRFDSDEMEVNEIKLFGARFVRTQVVRASQNDPPGRKPGQQSAKDWMSKTALSILNDEVQRPTRGHGRKTALARMVCALQPAGWNYQVATIERYIRKSVKEWEAANPEK